MAVLFIRGPAPPSRLMPDQHKLIVLHSVMTSFALVTVITRSYIRAVKLKAFKTDDTLMAIAALCNIIALANFVKAVEWGQGRPPSTMKGEWWPIMLHYNFTFNVFAHLMLSAAKLSIAFHLIRLTQGYRYKKVLYGMVAILAVSTVWALLIMTLQCIPIAAIWNYMLRPIYGGTAKCLSESAFTKINVVNNSIVLATDIILAILPIPLVWTLQVPKRIKFSLAFILGLGFFACFACIIKMYHALHIFENNIKHNLNYNIWLIVEMNLAIIAASLPTIRPLIGWVIMNIAQTLTGSKKSKGTNPPTGSPPSIGAAKPRSRGPSYPLSTFSRDMKGIPQITTFTSIRANASEASYTPDRADLEKLINKSGGPLGGNPVMKKPDNVWQGNHGEVRTVIR